MTTVATDVAIAAPPPVLEVPNLRKRAVRGSVWTIIEFAFSQAFRFGSNLVLLYWLPPEALGLMFFVNVLLMGLQMFSDIGIGPSIIQNKRGDDPAFLNTAWTIQVIRGFVLWIVGCALAYPFSLLWYPELRYLVPVAAFNAVIAGFASTSLFVLNRRLTLGRLSILRIATQLLSIAAMIGWAYFSPTVWALVAGTLFSSLVRAVLSHFLAPGQINRFHWDSTAVRELIHFGRWITLSTIITFLAMQIDKLMFAALFPQALMAVYGYAFMIAEVLPQLSKQLGNAVGFPALSELYRGDLQRFLSRLRHMRFLLVVPINLGLLFLVFVAQPLICSIFPVKYIMAGWIIQVLAVNSLAGMVNTSYGHAILATGRTFYTMIAVAATLVCMVVGSLTGYYLQGGTGFIMGVGMSQWLLYPAYVVLARRCGCWQAKFDAAVLIGFGVAAVAALIGGDIITRAWFL